MPKPHRSKRRDITGRRGAIVYRGGDHGGGSDRATRSMASARRDPENADVVCPDCGARVATCFAPWTDKDAGIWSGKTRVVSHHRDGGGRVTAKTWACAGSGKKVDDGRWTPPREKEMKPLPTDKAKARNRLFALARSRALANLADIHEAEYDALFYGHKLDLSEETGVDLGVHRGPRRTPGVQGMPRGWIYLDDTEVDAVMEFLRNLRDHRS